MKQCAQISHERAYIPTLNCRVQLSLCHWISVQVSSVSWLGWKAASGLKALTLASPCLASTDAWTTGNPVLTARAWVAEQASRSRDCLFIRMPYSAEYYGKYNAIRICLTLTEFRNLCPLKMFERLWGKFLRETCYNAIFLSLWNIVAST